MSYVGVGQAGFGVKPSPAVIDARSRLASFLTTLQAFETNMGWGSMLISASPTVEGREPEASTPPVIVPTKVSSNEIQIPDASAVSAKGAWVTLLGYIAIDVRIKNPDPWFPFAKRVSTMIPMVKDLLAKVDARIRAAQAITTFPAAPPPRIIKAGLPWPWIIGGGLLIAGAVFFVGRPPGKRKRRKGRRRSTYRRPRRGRR